MVRQRSGPGAAFGAGVTKLNRDCNALVTERASGTRTPFGRRQCKVHCRSRMEYRRASGMLDPDPPNDTSPPNRRDLDVELQDLPAASRTIWTNVAERERIINELLDAEASDSPDRMGSALSQIDTAVTDALNLLGLPRGPVDGPIATATSAYAGIKRPACTLEISTTVMRANLTIARGSDTTLRTWVHESIHGRRPYADGHLAEYRPWSGYEEGLADGLARIIVRGRAGLDPSEPTYRHPVMVYETLAAAADIDYEHLLRTLSRQPAGRVRGALLDAIDAGRRARSLPVLTDAQRSMLATIADTQFATTNSAREPSREVMLTLWRRGLR